MKYSAEIDGFVSKAEKADGFWDFAYGYQYPSSSFWDMGLWDNGGGRVSEEVPRAFNDGYKLAKKAGDKPVYYIDREYNSSRKSSLNRRFLDRYRICGKIRHNKQKEYYEDHWISNSCRSPRF